MRTVLSQPPEVKQTGKVTCWAAALEAWLCVTKNRTYVSQADLLEKYKSYSTDAPDQSLYQGISITGIKALAATKEISMSYQIFYQLASPVTTAGNSLLAPNLLSDKLKKKGHLFLIHRIDGGAHATVVYGYDDTNVLTIANPDLKVMDPGKGYTTRSFESYRFATPVFLGWPS